MKLSSLLYALAAGASLSAETARAQLTNHVEIVRGVFFDLVNIEEGQPWEPTNQFSAFTRIGYSICSARTNVLLNRLPDNQTFAFKLYDGSMHEVPKTKAGLAMSSVLDPTKSAEKLKVKLRILGRPSINYGFLFRPQDYFQITNRGDYTLEVSIRVWTESGRRKYGVLVSSPVRVRVVEP